MNSPKDDFKKWMSIAENTFDECGDGYGMPQPDQEPNISVNSNSDNKGHKSVNVTASGSAADELLNILKMAGLDGNTSGLKFDEEMLKVKDGGECGCNKWNCKVCFPDHGEHDHHDEKCPSCGHDMDSPMHEVSCGVAEELENENGEESPLTYGEYNLGEEEVNAAGIGDEPPEDPESQTTMIDQIMYMQDIGLSGSNKHYSEQQLYSMPEEQLKQIHQEVLGNVSGEGPPEDNEPIGDFGNDQTAEPEGMPVSDEIEDIEDESGEAEDQEPVQEDWRFLEATKPLKPSKVDDFSDIDDILKPKADYPLTGPEDDSNDYEPEDDSESDIARLPSASAEETRRRTGNINPSELMRDFLNRINPDIGAEEPDIPDVRDDLVVRTARDVPAVISSAIQAAGVQNPLWHTINNLPGYMQRNIRGMGRQIFGMMTRTPLEDIQTIANVQGQGPNTDAEMRAVAGWLRNHADDLGPVHMDYGMAIPGYEPEVREYSARGVRFHVVRDPMGQYIYAYPEQDAKLNNGNRPDDDLGLEGDIDMTPRLRESINNIFKPTLFEQIMWDEEIKSVIRKLEEDESIDIDEAFGKPTAKERELRRKEGFEKRKAEYDKAMANFNRQVKDYMKDNPGSSEEDAELAVGPRPEEPEPLPQETATLRRRLGKAVGSKLLIQWIHKNYKLSNVADIVPARMSSRRLLWGEFKKNPDQFIIVVCENGVAGIKPNKEDVEAVIEKAKKDGKDPLSIHWEKQHNVRYEFAAFKDDGEKLSPEAFNLWKKKTQATMPKKKTPAGDDTGASGERNPLLIKPRMGLHSGVDTQNPDNIFNYLTQELGPVRSVYLTGEIPEGLPDEEQPIFTPQVERGKISKREEFGKEYPSIVKQRKRTQYLPREYPEMDIDKALQKVFERIRPVLKQVLNQTDSFISRRIQKANAGKDYKTTAELGNVAGKIQELLAAIDTSRPISIINPRYGSPEQLLNKVFMKAIIDGGNEARKQDFEQAKIDREEKIKELDYAQKAGWSERRWPDVPDEPVIGPALTPGNEAFRKYVTKLALGNVSQMAPVFEKLRDNLTKILSL